MVRQPLSKRTAGIRLSEIKGVVKRVGEARSRGIEIADFSAGKPDLDTPAHIKEAAKEALDAGLVHYAASVGHVQLRQAICKRFHEDYELEIDPDEIVITMGSTEAIYIGLQSIVNIGDEILLPEPMYGYYIGCSLLGGAKPVAVPLLEERSFRLNAEALKEYTTPRTKALILNSPHNPTGQVFEKKDLCGIAELAEKEDFYVVCDDAYSHFLYDDAEHFVVAGLDGMRERTLIAGSFSKTYAMDGWRIGYLIAPRQVISRAIKIHQYAVNSCNPFVQIGAQAALTGSQQCVSEMVEEFARRRRLLLSYLDKLGLPYVRPRGAFYVFPSIREFGLSSKEFSEFLFKEARVAVVPGDAFGAGGRGYIRMAYCMSCEEIEKGMERVGSALEKL